MTALVCARCYHLFIPLDSTHLDGTPKPSMLCSSCQPKPDPVRQADAVFNRLRGAK